MMQEFSRTQRVGGQIQRELAQIIQQELRDPRLGMVTISAVEVSKDMAHAKVFITLMNTDQDVDATLKVLKKASGFLRRALGKRITLRVLPDLHFVYDSSLDEGMRIAALLDTVAAEDKEHEE
ncbi:MAG: 30S ribosome-binding factor RbfA [Gammaproteobacteria bacterium]